MHRDRGEPVRIVIATDGAAGDPDAKYDPATYGASRRSESRRAMAQLGCEDIEFWGFRDSCVITDSDIEGIALRVQAECQSFRPDVVYAPWEGEANGDHRAIYCGTLRGLRKAGFQGVAFGYELWGLMVPDVVLNITPVAERKFTAMSEFQTQLAYCDYVRVIRGQNTHRSILCNRGKGFAEVYRRIVV